MVIALEQLLPIDFSSENESVYQCAAEAGVVEIFPMQSKCVTRTTTNLRILLCPSAANNTASMRNSFLIRELKLKRRCRGPCRMIVVRGAQYWLQGERGTQLQGGVHERQFEHISGNTLLLTMLNCSIKSKYSLDSKHGRKYEIKRQKCQINRRNSPHRIGRTRSCSRSASVNKFLCYQEEKERLIW